MPSCGTCMVVFSLRDGPGRPDGPQLNISVRTEQFE